MTPAGGTQMRSTGIARDDALEVQTQRTVGQDRTDEGNLAKWQRMKRILRGITHSLTGVQEVEIREKIRGKVFSYSLIWRQSEGLRPPPPSTWCPFASTTKIPSTTLSIKPYDTSFYSP